MLMSGVSMLNTQQGRYVSVPTPSTVACVSPHEFQGISTEVTEIEYSNARLCRRG